VGQSADTVVLALDQEDEFSEFLARHARLGSALSKSRELIADSLPRVELIR
jgi:hypothetical protein